MQTSQLISISSMSPQIVKLAGFVPYSANKSLYNTLTTRPKTFVKTISYGLDLYEAEDNKFFIDDTVNGVLAYLVEFETYRYKFKIDGKDVYKNTITQVKVWRDRLKKSTLGITEDIFFNYLLPKVDVILSSDEQSEDGAGFWQRMITEAFEKGLKVGYWDGASKVALYFDDLNHTTSHIQSLYGVDVKYQKDRLFVEK